CVPPVVSAELRGLRPSERIHHRHPDALVATTIVHVHVQDAGLAETAVSTLLPHIRKDRELLPPVRVGRGTFRSLREHRESVRAEVHITTGGILATQEVLDVGPRR